MRAPVWKKVSALEVGEFYIHVCIEKEEIMRVDGIVKNSSAMNIGHGLRGLL